MKENIYNRLHDARTKGRPFKSKTVLSPSQQKVYDVLNDGAWRTARNFPKLDMELSTVRAALNSLCHLKLVRRKKSKNKSTIIALRAMTKTYSELEYQRINLEPQE